MFDQLCSISFVIVTVPCNLLVCNLVPFFFVSFFYPTSSPAYLSSSLKKRVPLPFLQGLKLFFLEKFDLLQLSHLAITKITIFYASSSSFLFSYRLLKPKSTYSWSRLHLNLRWKKIPPLISLQLDGLLSTRSFMPCQCFQNSKN